MALGRQLRRAGYIPPNSDHFYGTMAALAQLLHCLIEWVACPMDPCAEPDSQDRGSAANKPKGDPCNRAALLIQI
jgi:hypothetical protein